MCSIILVFFSSSSKEQVSLLDFSSVSRNSSFKCYGKIGRTGGCHGICFTTRAKGGIEPDVLEKDKEPIEVDVHNGNFHTLKIWLSIVYMIMCVTYAQVLNHFCWTNSTASY